MSKSKIAVREKVLLWLLGECAHPDTGAWFERPEGRKGNFWWRTELREAMLALCPDAPDANGVAVAWMRDAGGGKHAICEKPVEESAWIPLYTSSAAPVDEGLRADAARYRWLRDKSPAHVVHAPSASQQSGNGIKVIYQAFGMDDRSKPTCVLFEAALDAAIDSAMREKKE